METHKVCVPSIYFQLLESSTKLSFWFHRTKTQQCFLFVKDIYLFQQQGHLCGSLCYHCLVHSPCLCVAGPWPPCTSGLCPVWRSLLYCGLCPVHGLPAPASPTHLYNWNTTMRGRRGQQGTLHYLTKGTTCQEVGLRKGYMRYEKRFHDFKFLCNLTSNIAPRHYFV